MQLKSKLCERKKKIYDSKMTDKMIFKSFLFEDSMKE